LSSRFFCRGQSLRFSGFLRAALSSPVEDNFREVKPGPFFFDYGPFGTAELLVTTWRNPVRVMRSTSASTSFVGCRWILLTPFADGRKINQIPSRFVLGWVWPPPGTLNNVSFPFRKGGDIGFFVWDSLPFWCSPGTRRHAGIQLMGTCLSCWIMNPPRKSFPQCFHSLRAPFLAPLVVDAEKY